MIGWPEGMVFNRLRDMGRRMSDRTVTATKEKATELTEETIETAVEQALNVLQVAARKVKEKKDIPSDTVSLETQISTGVIELKIAFDVATQNPQSVEETPVSSSELPEPTTQD